MFLCKLHTCIKANRNRETSNKAKNLSTLYLWIGW